MDANLYCLSAVIDFFFPGVISPLPPTPSKVSLRFTTDTAFLWGY